MLKVIHDRIYISPCEKCMFQAILLMSLLVAASFSYPVYEDQEEAATGDGKSPSIHAETRLNWKCVPDHHGRVQIKVYRGPSEHEHFAPWGYWVKQPADDGHY